MISAKRKLVLSPRAEKFHSDASLHLAPRSSSLSNKAICLVDNRKPNAGLLMESIARVLSRDYAPARVDIVRKGRAGAQLADEVFEQITTEYDMVVEGLCS